MIQMPHAKDAKVATASLPLRPLRPLREAPLAVPLGMNTLADTARRAFHQEGYIVIVMESGIEVRFPIAKNPRLARGTPAQLNRIELSPLGLHWPDLDEDLSFRGLLDGNFGQHQKLAQ